MTHTVFRFFDVLGRMSTAIWALALLALASVVGTFIVQLTSHEVLEARYGVFWAEVFNLLQVDTLYSAWWFLGLAGFLVLSVSTCLVRNGPRLWRQLHAGSTTPNIALLRNWPATFEGVVSFHEVDNKLHKEGFKPQKRFANGESFWIKSKVGRWGYFLTHGAVVLLSLGAILTGVFGYRLTLHLVEGEAYDFAARWQTGEFVRQNLPFSLTNNQTRVEHYFTGMPRQFRTDLTLASKQGAEKNVLLEVNSPVDFEGHRIYQADYGDGGSRVEIGLRPINQKAGNKKVKKTNIHTGRTGFNQDIHPLEDVTLIPQKLQPRTVVDLPRQNGEGKKPTDIGTSVEVSVQTPAAQPKVLKLFQDRPWLIGLGSRPSATAQIEENITSGFDMFFLGLDPTKDAGWPLVGTLMADTPPQLKTAEKLKAYYTQKLPRVGDNHLKSLPEAQRLRQGLGAIMAATTLQQLELPFVPVLKKSEFRPFSGVIISYDPGFWFFVLGGVFLVIGSFLMIYFPLVRLWVRQTNKKNVILIAATSRKDAALPALDKLFNQNPKP